MPNVQPPPSPATAPLEMKTYAPTETSTQMFTATSFVTAPSWKRPRCPSMGEEWYLATNKEKPIGTHNHRLDGHPENHAKWKQPMRKVTCCMSLYTMSLGRQKQCTDERPYRLRRRWRGKEVDVSVNGQPEGFLGWKSAGSRPGYGRVVTLRYTGWANSGLQVKYE